MPVSAPFGEVLAQRRPEFNARALTMKSRVQGFNGGAFAVFLEQCIDPLIVEIAKLDRDRVAQCVDAAYDIGLELMAHGLGSVSPKAKAIEKMWQMIIPSFAKVIAQDPFECLGMMTNACINMEANRDLRLNDWLLSLGFAANNVATTAQLQAVLKLTAWRAGAAHFRLGALAAGATLPAQIACACLGQKRDMAWSDFQANFEKDPWWSPDERARTANFCLSVGAFAGFGGRFSAPPIVKACPAGFYVASGPQYYLLIADVYGATFHAVPQDVFTHQRDIEIINPPRLNGSELTTADRKIDVDLPKSGLALSANQHTIAVTSPFSHMIKLYPRVLR
jgi:hypothetical protein